MQDPAKISDILVNFWPFGQNILVNFQYFGQISAMQTTQTRYLDPYLKVCRLLCSTFNCLKTPAGCVPLCTHLELSTFYNGSCGIMNPGEEYHTKVQVTKEGNLSR